MEILEGTYGIGDEMMENELDVTRVENGLGDETSDENDGLVRMDDDTEQMEVLVDGNGTNEVRDEQRDRNDETKDNDQNDNKNGSGEDTRDKQNRNGDRKNDNRDEQNDNRIGEGDMEHDNGENREQRRGDEQENGDEDYLEWRDVDNIEEDAVKQFVEKGCGCRWKCSRKFTCIHFVRVRNYCTELTRTELDLVLMGQIMAFLSEKENCKFFHLGEKVKAKELEIN